MEFAITVLKSGCIPCIAWFCGAFSADLIPRVAVGAISPACSIAALADACRIAGSAAFGRTFAADAVSGITVAAVSPSGRKRFAVTIG